MGVDQRTGEGSKPRIPRVVSKSDGILWTATLTTEPAGTIRHSNLSLSYYPIHKGGHLFTKSFTSSPFVCGSCSEILCVAGSRYRIET